MPSTLEVFVAEGSMTNSCSGLLKDLAKCIADSKCIKVSERMSELLASLRAASSGNAFAPRPCLRV